MVVNDPNDDLLKIHKGEVICVIVNDGTPYFGQFDNYNAKKSMLYWEDGGKKESIPMGDVRLVMVYKSKAFLEGKNIGNEQIGIQKGDVICVMVKDGKSTIIPFCGKFLIYALEQHLFSWENFNVSETKHSDEIISVMTYSLKKTIQL